MSASDVWPTAATSSSASDSDRRPSITAGSCCPLSDEIVPDSVQRQKKCSIASQITFANLFGSAEEDFDDVSTDLRITDDNRSRTLIYQREGSRCHFLRVEYMFFLYAVASSISRVNLTQVFRVKQCLTVFDLNVTMCDELFKLEDVRKDDLEKSSDSLINAHLGVESAAGAVLVFILSQYLVKCGLKRALFSCLLGSCLSHVIIYITIYFLNVSVYYTFLSTVPLLLTGGNIMMATLTCTHIGTTSTGNGRRWRFFTYQFCVLCPKTVAELLNAFLLPNMGRLSLELWAICILVLALVWSIFFLDSQSSYDYETQSLKQQMSSCLNWKSFEESVMCFLRKRTCRARVQLLMLICMLASTAFYFDFFSPMQATYMSTQRAWDSIQFVTVSAVASAACYLLGIVVHFVLTNYIRPLDPTVIAMGFVSLMASYVCLSTVTLTLISYYGALTLMSMPILAISAMQSHLCQLLEKSELAPVFAVICSLESVSRILAALFWKELLSEENSQLDPLIVYLGCAGFLLIPFVASL